MTIDFSVDDWSTPKKVTIQGQDDSEADGDLMYTIEIGKPVTADANYSSIDPADILLSNTDDEPKPPAE